MDNIGPLRSACRNIIMQFTGCHQPVQLSSSARKCYLLASTGNDMRNVICVGCRQTSTAHSLYCDAWLSMRCFSRAIFNCLPSNYATIKNNWSCFLGRKIIKVSVRVIRFAFARDLAFISIILHVTRKVKQSLVLLK